MLNFGVNDMFTTPPSGIQVAKLPDHLHQPCKCVLVYFLQHKQVIEFSQGVSIRQLHQLIVFLSDQLSSSFIIELHFFFLQKW